MPLLCPLRADHGHPQANDSPGQPDGDGHVDVVTAASVSVLLGKGDGTFAAPVRTNLAAGITTALVQADLDGDGHLDVAVASSAAAPANGVFTVRFGDDSGGFGGQVAVPVSPDPLSITAAPISGVTSPDLVVVEHGEQHSSRPARTSMRGEGSTNTQLPASNGEVGDIGSWLAGRPGPEGTWLTGSVLGLDGSRSTVRSDPAAPARPRHRERSRTIGLLD